MNIWLKMFLAMVIFAAPIFAQSGAIVAVDEAVGSSGAAEGGRVNAGSKATELQGKSYSKPTASKSGSATIKNKPTTKTPSAPVRSGKPYSGPVLGDTYSFLNFEVISAEKPIYRRAAKQSGAQGLVQVAILVDTDGSVLQAKARTGNKLLWDEAERAALASKLNRPILNGQSVRALGFLVYRFGAADEDDDDN